MSVESLAIALNHSKAKGVARLVLIGMANHDGDGGIWPSVERLRRYAGGVDRRTVQRAVEQLIALGEVGRLVNEGGTRSTPNDRRPNLYRFLLSCPPDCDRTSAHNTRSSTRVGFRVSGVDEGDDCLLYTSDAADDLTRVDLGGCRGHARPCLLYTSPSPRDGLLSRMPSSA